MKTKSFIAVSLTILCTLLLPGCKNNRNNPDNPQSIIGTTARPGWTKPDIYDMTSSMTAIIKVDMTLTYSAKQLSEADYHQSDNDMLAAFEGENCLGVAEQKNNMFFLYISAPKENTEVQLRFYSDALRNIYTANESLTFSNDACIGTILYPYTPKFELAK